MVEYKFVFMDGEKTKLIRGVIISEEEHIIKVKSSYDNGIVIIGKKSLVSAVPMADTHNNS